MPAKSAVSRTMHFHPTTLIEKHPDIQIETPYQVMLSAKCVDLSIGYIGKNRQAIQVAFHSVIAFGLFQIIPMF